MPYTSKSLIVAKGTGKFYFADKSATPIAATWTEKFQTLKDSFALTQEDGETSETYVDQSDLPIKQTFKAGKMTLKFTIPNVAKSMLTEFFNTVTVSEAAPAGYEATGVKVDTKKLAKMIKVELAEQDLILIFPNLDIFRKFSGDNVNETPLGIEVTATVLANTDPAAADIIFLNKMDGTA